MNKVDLMYPLRLLSDLITYIGSKTGPPMAQLHKNTYSTHIPILIGLSSQIDVRRVLELGSGDYSTKLFLNKNIFPQLTRLDSFESDLGWGEKIRIAYAQDARLSLNIVDRPIHESLKSVNFNDYDLVFIDDSVRPIGTATFIRTVS